MRILLIFTLLVAMACSNKEKPKEKLASVQATENFIAVLFKKQGPQMTMDLPGCFPVVNV